MSKIDDIVRQLCELRVSELCLLLEPKWGVGPVAASVSKSEVNAKAKAVHDVVLIKSGQSKIAIIKEIRSLLSLGLKEAKEFVDSAPKPIKRGLDKPEASALKAEVGLR
ncbi:50S ribosomal subunit L7/L12 [Candidatus Hodgkinia cicadicola]|nr:50S ribosomal subunit L7/L12 [Candidatus Hodgkinia cicadicola]